MWLKYLYLILISAEGIYVIVYSFSRMVLVLPAVTGIAAAVCQTFFPTIIPAVYGHVVILVSGGLLYCLLPETRVTGRNLAVGQAGLAIYFLAEGWWDKLISLPPSSKETAENIPGTGTIWIAVVLFLVFIAGVFSARNKS
jgi:hypothetical protein